MKKVNPSSLEASAVLVPAPCSCPAGHTVYAEYESHSRSQRPEVEEANAFPKRGTASICEP